MSPLMMAKLVSKRMGSAQPACRITDDNVSKPTGANVYMADCAGTKSFCSTAACRTWGLVASMVRMDTPIVCQDVKLLLELAEALLSKARLISCTHRLWYAVCIWFELENLGENNT